MRDYIINQSEYQKNTVSDWLSKTLNLGLTFTKSLVADLVVNILPFSKKSGSVILIIFEQNYEVSYKWICFAVKTQLECNGLHLDGHTIKSHTRTQFELFIAAKIL